MIALGPREIAKALLAVLLFGAFLHIVEQVEAGLVAAHFHALPPAQ